MLQHDVNLWQEPKIPMAFVGTSDGPAAGAVQQHLDHCITHSSNQGEIKDKPLCSSVGLAFMFSPCCCTQQRHSHALLAQGTQGQDGACGPWCDTALPHTGEAPRLSVDLKQPLSLTPASCWVIASSDGKDSHGNGAAPGVFSHIPPQAKVIITFLCKTPCKTGELFSFF